MESQRGPGLGMLTSLLQARSSADQREEVTSAEPQFCHLPLGVTLTPSLAQSSVCEAEEGMQV